MKTTTPTILIILSLVCVRLLPQAHAVVPSPDSCYPGLRLRKDAMRLIFSPPALETQESVGIHSFQPAPPTTTRVSALERWFSIPQIPIPPWALQRFCSTRLAH